MAFLRRKAVKPPGFYRRLNALSTVDLEWAGNRSSSNLRLEVGEEDELPDGCYKVDRVVAKRAFRGVSA